MAARFGAVGLVFFACRSGPSNSSTACPLRWACPPPRSRPGSFFPILALGYMYLVTLLAGLMFKNPAIPCFPLLLAQGKFASSILSLGFLFRARPVPGLPGQRRH